MAAIRTTDLVSFLGAVQVPEVMDEELPIGLQCEYLSVEHIRKEGDPTHDWPMGVVQSPYPDDDLFVLVIYVGGDIARWSDFTPDIAMQWTGTALAAEKAFDVDQMYDWTMIGNGLIPIIQQFSNAWLENRSEVWERRAEIEQVRALSPACAEIVAKLVLSFSHEAEPWWVRNFLNMVGRWNPPRRRHAAVGHYSSYTWGHILEATATQFFTRYPAFSRNYGIRGPAFAKIVALLAAEFVRKRYPDVSFHYTMESDSTVHKVPVAAVIGLTLPWSNGRVIPFSGPGSAISVSRMVRKITLKGIKDKQERERGEPNADDRTTAAVGLVKSRFGSKVGGKIGSFLKSLEVREREKEAQRIPANVADLILAFVGFPESPSVQHHDGNDGDDSAPQAKRARKE